MPSKINLVQDTGNILCTDVPGKYFALGTESHCYWRQDRLCLRHSISQSNGTGMALGDCSDLLGTKEITAKHPNERTRISSVNFLVPGLHK